MSGHSHDSPRISPDLRNLVRAASQLQEQVRSAVQRLEQSTTPPEPTPPASGPETLHSDDGREQGTSQGRQRPVTREEAEYRTLAAGQTMTLAQTRAFTPVARMNYSSRSLSSRSVAATSGQRIGSFRNTTSIPPLSQGAQSTSSESLSSIFNWNPGNSVGQKRKGLDQRLQKKKKAIPMWTHNFVCLSDKNAINPPDMQERASLQIAGLGEKRVSFNVYADAHDVYHELMNQFPKLSEGGGFELLRVNDRGGAARRLELINPPKSGYDVLFLKAVVQQAKIYIRPLQKNLSCSPSKEENVLEPLKEKCLSCGGLILLSNLRQHMEECLKEGQLQSPNHDDDENSLSPGPSPQTSRSISLSPTLSNVDEEFDSSEELKVPGIFKEPQALKDIVQMLKRKIDTSSDFDMVVRRSHVLRDALRRMDKASFDPRKKLNVVFVGEEGADTGGLSREFFRLVCYSISNQYLESTGCFRHDATAYQERIYRRLGILAAMALVHGGGSFALFCPTVFEYLHGVEPSHLIANIDEVPDQSVRDTLQDIHNAADEKEMREVAGRNIDLLLECGYTKPVALLKLDDKSDLVHAVTLHKVVLSSLAELDQFRSGLAALGVRDSLQQYHELHASFYCMGSGDSLTSDSLRKLFTVIRYSNKGTSSRVKEETAFSYFVDYLDACEGVVATAEKDVHGANEDISAESSENKVSLGMILSFFTGADSVPPSGYNQVVLNFSETPYPTASTCAMELTLPINHDDYAGFKQSLDVAFTMHGGFGLM